MRSRLAAARLARCHDIDDLRALAARRLPRPVFDYVDGGADDERTLARNRSALAEFEFHPRVLRDVSAVDTGAELLGERHALPLVLAPTGYSRMLDPAGGEAAVARAAGRSRLPYTLSTVASTSIACLARAAPQTTRWFQLYIWRDRGLVQELIDRAWEHGNRVLEVSVDVPVSGLRRRDVRNGLAIPPRPTVRTAARVAARPGYWMRLLTNPPVRFANAPASVEREAVTIATMSAQFDPSVTWDELASLRERWRGRLLVKGPLGAADAERAIDLGADGVHLSNHGGRQLDRCVAPVDLLPEVREVIGDRPLVICDSGIRSGQDLAVVIARGADAGAIGKAYLYGLMAGGEAGVGRALELIGSQFERTLALLGAASVAELRAGGSELVRPAAPQR